MPSGAVREELSCLVSWFGGVNAHRSIGLVTGDKSPGVYRTNSCAETWGSLLVRPLSIQE
jgi:hypothetical protein